MKKLISTILALAMVFSLSTTAFAATSVSDFTDEDYLTIHPDDYYTLRDKSNPFKGVSWNEGAKVIYGETGMYGGIPGVKTTGVWTGSPNVDTSVKDIKFPKSVVILGFMALSNRDTVTSVNFEELVNLKHIGTGAFNRVQIKTADLSKTKVISIDDGAFQAGTQPTLTSFTAPSTLKVLGNDVFANQTRLNTITLNEGLEIIGDGALKDSGTTIIPSTVKEIGKNALNPERTYRVYKGSYAEQYCKDNNIKYIYTDNTSPTNPTNPTDPTTPSTNFPTMEYTKQIGPVTFSNYVSHTQSNPSDANGNKIDVTWVKISDKGSMRADKDNTEFLYNCFDTWNTTNEKSIGRTDNKFGNGRVQGDDVTIKTYKITPYPTTKTNGTWSKGLTWQFNYNAEYTNQNSFDITVEQGGQKYYYFVSVVTDKPTQTTPTTPTTPTAPSKATANPTNSKVTVDGKVVAFDAYNINNNNYFKLRDVAQIIRGTDKQFNVTWDGSKNAINLLSNTAYKTVGGELKAGDGKVKNATLSTSTIYKDGSQVGLTAYTINDNNYFKLRDLGEAFNFEVSWDGVNNTVVIDTSKGYTAE